MNSKGFCGKLRDWIPHSVAIGSELRAEHTSTLRKWQNACDKNFGNIFAPTIPSTTLYQGRQLNRKKQWQCGGERRFFGKLLSFPWFLCGWNFDWLWVGSRIVSAPYLPTSLIQLNVDSRDVDPCQLLVGWNFDIGRIWKDGRKGSVDMDEWRGDSNSRYSHGRYFVAWANGTGSPGYSKADYFCGQ